MNNIVSDSPLEPESPLLCQCALVMSTLAVVTSLFHFWPFGNHAIWRLLLPANTLSGLWLLVLACTALLPRYRGLLIDSLPHVSVLAYLAINVMSISVANDPGRAVSYTAKVILFLVGSYSLFRRAALWPKQRMVLYRAIVATAAISVIAALVTGAKQDSQTFGFFGSPFKCASYLSVLVPMAASYLLLSARIWIKLAGGLLLAAALATGTSMGLVLSLGVGMLCLCCGRIGGSARLTAVLAVTAGLLIAIGSGASRVRLLSDFSLLEGDGLNMRQRYLEWQAEINLLGERSIAGSGAGDINSQRSEYYDRLPKLNTLQPFDQNGWLGSAAETGLLGMICFCWIVLYYGGVALRSIKTSTDVAMVRCQRANLVALSSACVAHLFSSLYYNGVLIAFVLLIAIIGTDQTDQKE